MFYSIRRCSVPSADDRTSTPPTTAPHSGIGCNHPSRLAGTRQTYNRPALLHGREKLQLNSATRRLRHELFVLNISDLDAGVDPDPEAPTERVDGVPVEVLELPRDCCQSFFRTQRVPVALFP